MSEKKVCSVCGRTGANGARYELVVDGKSRPVHRPCGESVCQRAPKGVEIKLHFSEEIRQAEQAHNFWSAVFAEAKAAAEKSGRLVPAALKTA